MVNEAASPTPPSYTDRPTVTISYSPSAVCNPVGAEAVRPGRANTPSDGTYEVLFCDGDVFDLKKDQWVHAAEAKDGRCLFSDAVTDRATLMGTMALAGGSGSGVYRIPFGATQMGLKHAAGISLRRTGPGPNPAGGPSDTNMVPISISG